MPVLDSPVWTEFCPLLASFKAQVAIVSVDVLGKGLPSAWHKVGLTVDFYSNRGPQLWAHRALVLSSGPGTCGR